MSSILYIVRGLPGSGKTTIAQKLVDHNYIREADMYFMKDGLYLYDSKKIRNAHEWCKQEIETLMVMNVNCAVANTFVKKIEYQYYINLAKKYDYNVQIVECHGSWSNTHGVSLEKLKKMKQLWENHIPHSLNHHNRGYTNNRRPSTGIRGSSLEHSTNTLYRG